MRISVEEAKGQLTELVTLAHQIEVVESFELTDFSLPYGRPALIKSGACRLSSEVSYCRVLRTPEGGGQAHIRRRSQRTTHRTGDARSSGRGSRAGTRRASCRAAGT